jgi:hypothetical protein
MNRYGQRAREHWTKWLPNRVAQMTDPAAFFTTLGEQAADEISRRADHLAGPDCSGEDYLTKLRRLRMAQFTAEETVLREMLLLPPDNNPDLDATTNEPNPPARDDSSPIRADPTQPTRVDRAQPQNGRS